MTNPERQFSVTNMWNSQGCALMPGMGGRLRPGVCDTAAASSGASGVTMLADAHEKVGCWERSHALEVHPAAKSSHQHCPALVSAACRAIL